MESKDLSVELKPDRPSYMVLRGTYGERVHEAFRLTRQGVRWRFQRVFGDMYVSAFEAILMIERIFDTQLRDYAMRISRERHALRQEVTRNGLQPGRIAPVSSTKRATSKRSATHRKVKGSARRISAITPHRKVARHDRVRWSMCLVERVSAGLARFLVQRHFAGRTGP